MRTIFGNIVKGFASLLDWIMKLLIAVIETLVNFVVDIGRVFVSILAMGGCLFFFFLAPILFNPIVLVIIFILLIFPLLGTTSVHWLKYINYSLIEFLNDYGDYLIDEDKTTFETFDDYKAKYRRMQEEEEERKREERRRAQEEEWERRFREFFDQMNQGGFEGGYYRQNAYGQRQYQQAGHQNNYQNPFGDFVQKYEEACDTLEVPYDADKYQIKLQYRKMAKKYHPDISTIKNANEIFQKINGAYDFLSDENIERYKKIKKN